MSTDFTPRNKKAGLWSCSVFGAELLRLAIGDDANISGVGYADYVSAKTAREYAKRIYGFVNANPNHEHGDFLTMFAKFFMESSGFWQT